MQQYTNKQRKIIYILFSISLFLALTLSGLLIFGQSVSKENQLTIFNGQKTPIPTPKGKEAISILLVGHGGADHDGGGLADTMMLVRADILAKKVSFVSIPRDTWTRIPTAPGIYEYHKLNHAFSIGNDPKYVNKEVKYTGINGGGELAKFLVEEITGIPIDYYVSIDFMGLAKAIDMLGSVDVEVAQTFDDYFYPIKGKENDSCGFSLEKISEAHKLYTGFNLEKQFVCRYEHLHFEKGKNTMNGETALKFVRSRHGDNGGDFARSQRQQALLLGIRDKAISLGALNDAPSFFRQFNNIIRTDLNEGILNPTLKIIGDPNSYSTKAINLSTDNVFQETTSGDGQYILVPKTGEFNWTGVQEFLKSEL